MALLKRPVSTPSEQPPANADDLEGTTNGLRTWVFWPAAVIVLAFVAFTLIAPKSAEALFAGLQSGIVSNFSWYYVLIVAFFVAFSIFVGFSRFGDIKLGKDKDEPEFSTGSWFALLFAAGMGIGLVFYGVAEPLSHFESLGPASRDPKTNSRSRRSRRLSCTGACTRGRSTSCWASRWRTPSTVEAAQSRSDGPSSPSWVTASRVAGATSST